MEPPSKVTELRSFLELANYYRRFICRYSIITAPLTDLLKKNHKWDWIVKCQEAFKELTKAMMAELVLALPIFTLQTSLSGGSIDARWHLIAFESNKLNDTELHYTIQEKR